MAGEDFSIADIKGSAINFGSGLSGVGTGCVADNSSGNIFDEQHKRKYVDISNVSTFCANQIA